MSRGVMICKGMVETHPIAVGANYYAFSQTMGDMMVSDKGSLANQPWIITLRGLSDYANFLYFLEAKKTVSTVPDQAVDLSVLPLERLKTAKDSYLRYYSGRISSQPGVYSVDGPVYYKPFK